MPSTSRPGPALRASTHENQPSMAEANRDGTGGCECRPRRDHTPQGGADGRERPESRRSHRPSQGHPGAGADPEREESSRSTACRDLGSLGGNGAYPDGREDRGAQRESRTMPSRKRAREGDRESHERRQYEHGREESREQERRDDRGTIAARAGCDLLPESCSRRRARSQSRRLPLPLQDRARAREPSRRRTSRTPVLAHRRGTLRLERELRVRRR